jgi:Tfp pilus assembly protein PilF
MANGLCDAAQDKLQQAFRQNPEESEILITYGDFAKRCKNDENLAKTHWQKALDARPAYAEQVETLKKALR